MYRSRSRRRSGRSGRAGIRIPIIGRVRLSGWGFMLAGILVMVFITPVRVAVMKIFGK